MRCPRRSAARNTSSPGLAWLRGIALLAALALFVPAVASAGEPPVAHVSIGADGITFDPVQEFESLVVKVGGGEIQVTRTFDGSAPAHFEIFDEEGDVFPDGRYKYQVTPVMLGAATRDRSSDNSKGRRQELIQWGSFAIDGGWLVDPGVSEGGEEN